MVRPLREYDRHRIMRPDFKERKRDSCVFTHILPF